MSLSEVSNILWRERQLLDLLVFKLEEEQLVLASGRTRWLSHATREVETILAEIKRVTPEGESTRVTLEVPVAFSKFVAPKGSIALDGVSLTVNEVDGTRFGVNLIPHTLKVTTFARAKPGTKVNFEIDPLARYVARLVGK